MLHVLNRGVVRMQVLEKPADYEAFERIVVEATSYTSRTSVAGRQASMCEDRFQP